ncbi:PREDICTED: putative disease resistance RPP13-like protein 1 [Fragaria vesca subsp. vesca]|uniref:putative disease resistance RPP13-like protein 1 n=1 Tax=Fragaria vesca subsp. vesca TaxID=101020 RepID=UPI0002C3348B|nr:PREDICTED: putative disease resistance RPP13-like protein 1 [Fragaria vesca subsp. vesca]
MAEIASLVLSTGITSAVLQIVIDRVTKSVEQKKHLFNAVDDNLRKLKRTLMNLRARVDDLEKKHCIINEAADDLLQDLQTCFLDAEDLLDKIGLGLERLTCLGVEVNTWSQVHDLIPFYSSIPSEITDMQLKLAGLVTELERFSTAEISQFTIPNSTSLVDECCVFGRDKDKYKMKDMVLSVHEVANVSVIPIVGMGGIGKTTLAQLVYNDADVHKKFDLKMWVSVSSDYGLFMITKSILESATGGRVSQLSSLDSVQVELQKTLKGKRFLLVLDGICNENLSYWDRFKLSFGAAKKGSKIMMTTRSEISASIVASTFYRLDPLCDKACWEIIKQRGNLDGQTDLEANGLAISKKCKGHPWVAKVIGSSLHSGEMEWDALLKNEFWELQEHKTQIYPGLKLLSYDDMPSYLKRCFSYCSIFPRDHVVEMDDLVQLWAAEGFIRSQGTTEIEDVGRQYFEDLHSRSVFSQVPGVSGDQQRYKMHELIHDLARFVSTNLCFCMEDNMPCLAPISLNARYASLLYENAQLSTLKAFYKYKKLRTFTFLPKVPSIPRPGMLLPHYPSNLLEVPHELFERLGCLRVLNLSRSAISKLPESIGNLIHLRYLNLSHTHIELLPKPLTTICGLETLKLKSCPKLLHLPENLKDLIKLRHLDFDRHRQLSSMPRDIGKLTSLETLHAFRVGKEKGYQIEELKDMRCLRGSISITNLENVADSYQAEAAMLHNKQYLDRLELEWNGIRGQMQPVQQEVLTGLEPHAGLKKLRVAGYCGLLFPKWIESSAFSKLESIDLENCPFCGLLPALGQLPALKELFIQNMSTLEVVDHLFCGHSTHSSAAFQSLETLTLRDMPELSKWSGLRDKDMPCLRILNVGSCPKLATLPTFQYLKSLQCLDINRCPQLQSLPDGGLPPSLETLIILESDILKNRCKEGEGADWNKIRWIPKKLIEDKVILAQRPDRPDNQIDEVKDAPESLLSSRNSLLVCSVIIFPLFVLFMRSLYQYLSQARD